MNHVQPIIILALIFSAMGLAMPVKFEWQTDKEQEWTDEPAAGGDTADSGLRHWRIWLILAAGLILIAVIAYILLNRRAESRSAIIANDVLACHQLVRQAVASRDAELFATLLLPYNQGWRETQEQLLDQGLFLDRVPLGLWAAPHLTASEPVVTLAPDLQTAVVTVKIPYIIETNDTLTETIVLENTAVYERDESQWLLAPPPHRDPYWGEWITLKGSSLELVFPERDAEIGYRLAADLDDAVVRMCQLTAVSCPPTFSLSIKLDSDYTQMMVLDEDYRRVHPRRAGANVYRLTLPTPTLVGRPLDEAGYQALLRGYAGWVTAVLVNELNRAQQLDHAAISRQLAQIDLRPSPLSRERPWQFQLPPPIPWPDQDLLTLCRVNDVRMEVWRYELAESNWVDETAAFREATSSLLDTSNGLILLPMPDDEGAVALGYDFREFGDDGVYLWQDGNVMALIEGVAFGSWMPTGYIAPGIDKDRFLVFFNQDDEQTESFTFEWLDLARCPGPMCHLQTGDGLPSWSPDEQKSLLIQMNVPDTPTIGLGDANGDETAEIGVGWSPSWIDDMNFIYLRSDSSPVSFETADESPSTELVLVELEDTIVSRTSHSLLTSDDLLATLPINGRPVKLPMYQVIVSPPHPDQWFIVATTSFTEPIGQDHLFLYDRASRELSSILALEDRVQGRIQVEGNGRYLALTYFETNGTFFGNNTVYLLYDLKGERTLAYPISASFFFGADWSADGRWFVIQDEAMLRLIAPGSRYERPIFHGADGCGSAVWVNR